MIEISISSNAEKILRQMQGLTPRMAAGIAKAMDRQNQLTIGHSQRSYLSGPRPQRLGVRTNRLRGSLVAAPARVSGNAIISAIGTNVAYAGIHERGFNGRVTVRAHSRNLFRTFRTGGGAVFDPKTGRISRTKPRDVALLTGATTVRAHARTMRMPARPYLAPAIADSQVAYSQAISAAIERAWGGAA